MLTVLSLRFSLRVMVVWEVQEGFIENRRSVDETFYYIHVGKLTSFLHAKFRVQILHKR